MQIEEFDYDLPKALIAQRPLAERDASRMLVLDRATQAWTDRFFSDAPQVLQPGDLIVFNNTKVFPARLLGRRLGTQAQKIGKGNPAAREYLTAEIELLLTRHEEENIWQGLARPGRKLRTGETIAFGAGELEAEIIGRGDYGLRRVKLQARGMTVDEAIERLGHTPLPPYIQRADDADDRRAYQTVYASERGSVAAPTAGLHFTERTLAALRARGVETCEITLHVGLGTFQPVHASRIEDHRMESEAYLVSEKSAAAIERAMQARRRIICVGTTTVRTLEHVARKHGGQIVAGSGWTSLFITPGFKFQITQGLLTNFHLPKSTLLMLVAALAGKDFVMRAYAHAVQSRYRFYSYGDCMLIL